MENIRSNYKDSLANKEFFENYIAIYNSFIVGAVTAAQWQNFCELCLEELMSLNKKVLKNLKNS